MSGECVISSILSHQNKDLKQQTKGYSLVTVKFYSASEEKYSLEVWGWADPKGEASIRLALLLLYICLPAQLQIFPM